ncbi:MAG: alpha-ketoglutarate-dependent dioxygenase AlkB family protein [Gammaproteobacteria bacterium]
MTPTACTELEIIEEFYDGTESEQLYNRLLNEQNWPDNRYCFAGRQFILPRLQTWHADAGIAYSYSNNLLETRSWTPLLIGIKAKIEAFLDYRFNSVLVNLYRNGEDYVGWHADDEPELGERPLIASLTFGAERRFAFRRKKASLTEFLRLQSGTLLIMRPGFQRHWQHSIPEDKSVSQGRINLTFRKVIPAVDFKNS